MAKRIILGSGSLYCTSFSGTLPTLTTICAEANRFSHIKNGATLEYSKEVITEKDDLGLVQKTAIKTEDVSFKAGLMTLSGAELPKLIETARSATSSETGKTLTKIGGLNNAADTSYAWCFHHKDAKDGDIYILIVGKNAAGCTLSFKQDGATVVDAEIKAEPCDNEGTLVYFFEETPSAQSGSTPT